MARPRFHPPLNKRLVLTQMGYKIYSVNSLAIRSSGQGNEEFDNFATHDEFPHLIPKEEIWVSQDVLDKEGIFFIANSLTRLKEKEKGTPEDAAYTAGLHVERFLRQRWNGIDYRRGKRNKRVPEKVYVDHYITLSDPKFPIDVWRVDGSVVRSLYKTDYTEGGHGYVYPWCPKNEIWVESTIDRKELPLIVTHEYLELRLMREKKLEYDDAHEIASKLEYKLRQGKGLDVLLAPGRRELTKKDLSKVTSEEVFAYVLRHYLREGTA
jgi:hypothetical protein